MQLLVFPGPDQGLANQVSSILSDIEGGDPTSDRLLPIGHCHDLLALKRQQQEALAFQLGPVRIFRIPPVEQPPHIVQEHTFQLLRRRGGMADAERPYRSEPHVLEPPWIRFRARGIGTRRRQCTWTSWPPAEDRSD